MAAFRIRFALQRSLFVAKTPAEKQKSLRARRRAQGLCPKCGRQPRPGNVCCQECVDSARLDYQAKNGERPSRRCSACGAERHNVRSCRATPVAATEGAA